MGLKVLELKDISDLVKNWMVSMYINELKTILFCWSLMIWCPLLVLIWFSKYLCNHIITKAYLEFINVYKTIRFIATSTYLAWNIILQSSIDERTSKKNSINHEYVLEIW